MAATSRTNQNKQPAAKASTPKPQANLSEEYVTASNWTSLYSRILSDDSEACQFLSDAHIDAMMLDPVASSNYRTLIERILADGLQVIPKITSDEAEGFDKAQEITTAFTDQIEGMPTSIVDLCEQLLSALKYANRIAEIVWSDNPGQIGIARVKVKPRGSVEIETDEFLNVTGFRPNGAGDVVLPVMKFILFSLFQEDADPRGTQHVRTIRDAVEAKRNLWFYVNMFGKLFAMPGIIAKTPPDSDAQVLFNEDTGNPVFLADGVTPKTVTPQRTLLNTLLEWQGKSALVLKHGTEFDLVEASTEGQFFWNMQRSANNEISIGILRQARATNEAENGSKADSETGAEIMRIFVLFLKRKLAQCLERQLAYWFTWLNYGEEAAHKYCPKFQFGDDDAFNWADDADAISKLGPSLTDSQYVSLTTSAGIPAPLEGEEIPKRTKAAPAGKGDDPNNPDEPAPDDPKKKDKPPQGGKGKEPKANGQRFLVRDVARRAWVPINSPLR